MNRWHVLLGLAALYAGGWGVKAVTLNLRYFKPSEFGASLPLLNPALLEKLDEFRHRLGSRVIISPAPGSLIRPAGDNESQHVYGRAADVMIPDTTLVQAYSVAREVGFTGIGVYPHWKPYKGLHLDVRPDRQPGSPAQWAGLKGPDGKQFYTSVERGLA
ncbi:MAG: DUF882 domain-containing protein [Deltaproteobacteria bacterium]|nr:DUF882 domain-containing protein [Deltaproteobacteria bacterium]MBZ0219070.1 DUF882 domain-containing protein [Deltaproteobacteria bacterium]